MSEWKLFDGALPEPPEYLRDRPWMNLEGQPGFAQRAQMVVSLVRHVGPVRSISDLGCGDGSLLARILDVIDVGPSPFPAWGYDLGAGDIAHGQDRGLDVRFGDVVAGPGIEYGELIIASEVVEHIADPEGFLRSLPGRLLIISSPASETGQWHNDIHAWAWDLDGYEALVRRSGWVPARHVSCDGGVNTFAGVTRQQRFQAILAVRLAVSGSMGTALITGAAGFVGRHFTKHLQERDWKVWAIDVEPAPWLTFYRTDALDFFRDWDHPPFDLVLHCAAVVGGRQVIDADPLAQAVNLELDAAMFRWAMRTRPGRVVYFSSSAAYPVSLQSPERKYRLAEDDIKFTDMGVPDQLYGWAKLTGELLARKAREKGLAVSVVRPFSGYGEDQSADYPFPAFVDRALRREDPFLVWGSGNQARDFIHIDDIVAAVMKMYEKEIAGPVNLGTGVSTSMYQLARMVCRFAGYEPEIETVPHAPSGVAYRVCSPGQMYKFHGPKVILEEGIHRALRYRERMSQPVPD